MRQPKTKTKGFNEQYPDGYPIGSTSWVCLVEAKITSASKAHAGIRDKDLLKSLIETAGVNPHFSHFEFSPYESNIFYGKLFGVHYTFGFAQVTVHSQDIMLYAPFAGEGLTRDSATIKVPFLKTSGTIEVKTTDPDYSTIHHAIRWEDGRLRSITWWVNNKRRLHTIIVKPTKHSPTRSVDPSVHN